MSNVRSKTSKKGLAIQRIASMRKCVSCSIVIPRICDVIHGNTLPKVINKIILSYVNAEQPIGYVMLHRPSRRHHHVTCIECHENMVDNVLTKRTETMICPCKECCVCVRVLDIHQNTLD